jgi:hypothetical protein
VFEETERLSPELRNRREVQLVERRAINQVLRVLQSEHLACEFNSHNCGDGAACQPLLAQLYRYFPGFPTWLVAGRIEEINLLTFTELFGHFTKTSLYRAFHQATERRPRTWEGACGFVFEWFAGKLMIIHDDPRPALCPGFSLKYRFGRKPMRRPVIVIERFETYVQTLAFIPELNLRGTPRHKAVTIRDLSV